MQPTKWWHKNMAGCGAMFATHITFTSRYFKIITLKFTNILRSTYSIFIILLGTLCLYGSKAPSSPLSTLYQHRKIRIRLLVTVHGGGIKLLVKSCSVRDRSTNLLRQLPTFRYLYKR